MIAEIFVWSACLIFSCCLSNIARIRPTFLSQEVEAAPRKGEGSASGSSGRPAKKRRPDDEEEEEVEEVAGLSGDEVDPNLIMPHRTRRAGQKAAPQYSYKAGDDEDSDDD
jgi:hypothetical protein